MEIVRTREPDVPNVLWNLGIWYAELSQYSQALEVWKHYREVVPDDWLARGKLIQAYESLGKTDLRDAQRAQLYELRESGSDSALSEAEMYFREQFSSADHDVMVFEYFSPTGERRVYLVFDILDAEGNEIFRYSLGSYDTTNTVAHELGQVEPDQRLYHLDKYHNQGHATLGMFAGMPSYEDVRSDVIEALQGKLKPLSSTEAAP